MIETHYIWIQREENLNQLYIYNILYYTLVGHGVVLNVLEQIYKVDKIVILYISRVLYMKCHFIWLMMSIFYFG